MLPKDTISQIQNVGKFTELTQILQEINGMKIKAIPTRLAKTTTNLIPSGNIDMWKCKLVLQLWETAWKSL